MMTDADLRAHFEAFGLDEHGNPPPLDPELADCIVEMGRGMLFVKHPLVNEHYVETMHDHLNKQLVGKRSMIERARRERLWFTYVWAHERPWRLHALREIAGLGCMPVEWSDLANAVWVDSENIHENVDEWRRVLTHPMMVRSAFMDRADADALDAMPERFTVYRGTCAPDRLGSGMSWSTDRDRATWFARRLVYGDRSPYLLTGRVRRDDVIGYLTGRGESEIVVMPENVRVMSTRPVTS